jgi:hypothetical protein
MGYYHMAAENIGTIAALDFNITCNPIGHSIIMGQGTFLGRVYIVCG